MHKLTKFKRDEMLRFTQHTPTWSMHTLAVIIKSTCRHWF